MKPRTIDVQKNHIEIQELISLLKAGEEIILTEGDKPIARILPVESPKPTKRIPDLHPNSVWMSDDFDAPLPDNFWT